MLKIKENEKFEDRISINKDQQQNMDLKNNQQQEVWTFNKGLKRKLTLESTWKSDRKFEEKIRIMDPLITKPCQECRPAWPPSHWTAHQQQQHEVDSCPPIGHNLHWPARTDERVQGSLD